jgi:bifunctional DNA-binding transcriptional regulator/antitoxin component of YhaV-PrlF toxin-antitoxin module
MKALGIVRKFDGLGRFVIPSEVRKTKGWDKDTPIEILDTEEGVLLRAYKPDFEKDKILNQLNYVLDNTENDVVQEIVEKTINFMKKG